ncbi:type VI secretion system baseplate subunit TssG [Paraburkholderia sp. D15]|uniref:type VI secretion system baseplate subunit TssG n=1 Tax=Paraburkholderia sp. D15 TaxID=2880218 RepID=UPI0024791B22|nr:type VI secretion system baseplate subunit TssG [Paraburkholderia sp. D15]WGS49447.1 type VI secretion system baseplate subunit TssG [Paraburkholderia sp. D15]
MTRAALPPLQRFWQQVADAPYAYDLFALLRWLDARAGRPARLGHAAHPGDEPLRIGQQPSLAFAPATLAEATLPSDDNAPPRVSIYSFGLFGPNGPLPLHLTEYARERARNHDDHALTAFADVFHHRSTLLFYRAWADAQPTVSLDRGEGARFDAYIASLIHLGLPSQMHDRALPAHATRFMAGHLVRQTRNPEGLRQMLQTYLGVPVEIVEFVPHWIPVDARRRTRLRAHAPTPTLGGGALLGVAVRDVQSKFELRLGPLSRAQFQTLLPHTSRAREIVQWVRLYAGVEWAWDLRLVLAAGQVSGMALGAPASFSNAQPLGWGSWLGTRMSDEHAGDFVYPPERYEPKRVARPNPPPATATASSSRADTPRTGTSP